MAAAAMGKPRDVTAGDWHKMSLMQKWKASYNQDYSDQRTSRMASFLGTYVVPPRCEATKRKQMVQ